MRRDKALHLIKRLQDAGHHAYLVGGCVRDELLNLLPHDYDIVSSAKPEQIEEALSGLRLIPTGRAFGVITAVLDEDQFQIATFRADGAYSDGRRPDEVRFVTTLEEDLARRDFTINAMALEPFTGQVFDYHSGRKDLRNKVIRFVGDPSERIQEDYLRMLRAIKFAVRLDFSIVDQDEYGNYNFISDFSHNLVKISQERISSEFQEIILYKNGLDRLQGRGLLLYVIPGIEALWGLGGTQDPIHHAEGDAWTHTLMVIDELRELTLHQYTPYRFELLLAGLLHDIAKPACQECQPNGRITNRGHAELGAKMADNICRHWLKLSNEQSHFVSDLVHHHMTAHHFHEMKKSKLMKWAAYPYIQELIWLQHADASGRETKEPKFSHLEFMTKKLAEFKLLPPRQQPNADSIIKGDHLIALGLKPGPDFKRILESAREAQMAGEFDDSNYQHWLEHHLGESIA